MDSDWSVLIWFFECIQSHDEFLSVFDDWLDQLYRDCLRLVRHIAPGATSAKAVALRQTVRGEFRKHAQETDPETITNLKANAVRALSNYLLAVSAPKDPRVSSAAKDFHGRSVTEAKAEKTNQLSSSSSSAEETKFQRWLKGMCSSNIVE